MKVIKLIEKVDINVDTEEGPIGGLYCIDFIPRTPLSLYIDYTELRVDTIEFSVDSIEITADMTVIDSSNNFRVLVINEFTKERFSPLVNLEVINSIYRLNFLETDFLTLEGRYSILIEGNNKTAYQGKMIFTEKDIQNYRYTKINNTKMCL